MPAIQRSVKSFLFFCGGGGEDFQCIYRELFGLQGIIINLSLYIVNGFFFPYCFSILLPLITMKVDWREREKASLSVSCLLSLGAQQMPGEVIIFFRMLPHTSMVQPGITPHILP